MSDRHLNGWATVLLSVAALATSWAGYQASLWSGEQAAHGGSSTAYRTTSTRVSTFAGQLRVIDVGLFTSWADAYARGDTLLAGFYERRFRAEFKPAFRAWIASEPLRSPNAAPTPFNLPEYQVSQDAEAARLALRADEESAASQRANRESDGYVLDAVILATVMFFASGAQHGSSIRIRVLLLSIAAAMCAAGLYRLLTSPRG